MKKLLIVVLLLAVLAGGCGPTFCDTKSPDYDPERCQQWGINVSQQLQMQQMQQDTWRLQQQQNRLQQQQNMQRLYP